MATCLTFMDVIRGYESDPDYNTRGRIVFGLHDVRMNYSDRKEELEKVNNFRKEVLVYLVMIIYPESKYTDAVDKNKNDVVSKWMIPTFKAMKAGKIKAKHIDCELEESDARKIRDSLRYNHDWKKFLISADLLDVLYRYYLDYLEDLMSDYKILHKEPSKEDFYKAFESIKLRIKKYR